MGEGEEEAFQALEAAKSMALRLEPAGVLSHGKKAGWSGERGREGECDSQGQKFRALWGKGSCWKALGVHFIFYFIWKYWKTIEKLQEWYENLCIVFKK